MKNWTKLSSHLSNWAILLLTHLFILAQNFSIRLRSGEYIGKMLYNQHLRSSPEVLWSMKSCIIHYNPLSRFVFFNQTLLYPSLKSFSITSAFKNHRRYGFVIYIFSYTISSLIIFATPFACKFFAFLHHPLPLQILISIPLSSTYTRSWAAMPYSFWVIYCASLH